VLPAQLSAAAVRTAAAAAALAIVLAGCGGGSDDGAENAAVGSGASAPTSGDEAETSERTLVTATDSEVEEVPAAVDVFGVDETVRFEPGGTSAMMSNAVVRGERNRYTLEAAAGQTMIVSIASLEDNAVFDVYGPDGALLAAERTSESIVLPSDGSYVIIVGGTRGNASDDLKVDIPSG